MLSQQLSQAKAAKLLGVSLRTVERWITAGVLPVQQYPGTGRKPIKRIDQKDLEEFMRQHRVERRDALNLLTGLAQRSA